MGRPTSLTPEIQKKICQAIRWGNYRRIAVEWAGVSLRTFGDWIKKGREQEGTIYSVFLQAVLQAERQAEIRIVRQILKSAKDDVKHGQWWLERKFPGRWAVRERRLIKDLEEQVKELQKAVHAITETANQAAP